MSVVLQRAITDIEHKPDTGFILFANGFIRRCLNLSNGIFFFFPQAEKRAYPVTHRTGPCIRIYCPNNRKIKMDMGIYKGRE